jgi:hypothetical protein
LTLILKIRINFARRMNCGGGSRYFSPHACDLDHMESRPSALYLRAGNPGIIDMKRALLLLAFAALAGTAMLPIRTTTPTALSDASGTEWSCSTSALVFTTCAPNHSLRLAASH